MAIQGIIKSSVTLPDRSKLVGFIQFVEMTGVHPARLGELVEMGWVEPVRAGEEYLFRMRDAYRLNKLERICRDFEVNATGGSIIVDLLERIESLERELRELRGLRL